MQVALYLSKADRERITSVKEDKRVFLPTLRQDIATAMRGVPYFQGTYMGDFFIDVQTLENRGGSQRAPTLIIKADGVITNSGNTYCFNLDQAIAKLAKGLEGTMVTRLLPGLQLRLGVTYQSGLHEFAGPEEEPLSVR